MMRIVPSEDARVIGLTGRAEGLRCGLAEVTTAGDIEKMDPLSLLAAQDRIARLSHAICAMTIMPTDVSPDEVRRMGCVPPFEFDTGIVSEDGTVRLKIDCSGMSRISFADEFYCAIDVTPDDVEAARTLPRGACVPLEGQNCTGLLRPGGGGGASAKLRVTLRKTPARNGLDERLVRDALARAGVARDVWSTARILERVDFDFDIHYCAS